MDDKATKATELLAAIGEHSSEEINVAALSILFPALVYGVAGLSSREREALLARVTTYLDRHDPVGIAKLPGAHPAARKLLRLMRLQAEADDSFFEGLPSADK